MNRLAARGDAFWTEPILDSLVMQGHTVTLRSIVPELALSDRWATLTDEHPKPEADLVVELDGVYEQAPREDRCKHTLHAYAKATAAAGFDGPIQWRRPYLYLSPEEERRVDAVRERRYVVFQIRARHYPTYKKIRGVDWHEVWRRVQGHVAVVRLIDDVASDQDDPPVVSTPDLRDIIPVIAGASLFIGPDAAPGHVAASLGVPSLIFYGSVNPLNWVMAHGGSHVYQMLGGCCMHPACYSEAIAPELPRCLDGCEPPPCTTYDTAHVVATILRLLDELPAKQPLRYRRRRCSQIS